MHDYSDAIIKLLVSCAIFILFLALGATTAYHVVRKKKADKTEKREYYD